MTIKAKEIFDKAAAYTEAMRYMHNAEETLKKSSKNETGRVFNDPKYVRSACGTAYVGVLIALEAWLADKGCDTVGKRPVGGKKVRKSIEFYQRQVSARDKKLLTALKIVYQRLHVDGYYDGDQDVKAVRSGFEHAYDIIDLIKPAEGAGAKK